MRQRGRWSLARRRRVPTRPPSTPANRLLRDAAPVELRAEPGRPARRATVAGSLSTARTAPAIPSTSPKGDRQAGLPVHHQLSQPTRGGRHQRRPGRGPSSATIPNGSYRDGSTATSAAASNANGERSGRCPRTNAGRPGRRTGTYQVGAFAGSSIGPADSAVSEVAADVPSAGARRRRARRGGRGEDGS